jgi:hypothetical protein
MRFSILRSGGWFVKEKGSLTTEKNESFVTRLGVEGASMLLRVESEAIFTARSRQHENKVA